ncbi:sushi, von Willebrand factor type A, EGF and pentraxin domain-containing protein 1 [Nephila pilipes]|uniref:Sushi, von Willebrand factor type A, EGF and pentraxin domain-containing protein 1 n=1 Tax=Nephila pilipes TaxID=299642 RepID=A0A8X6NSW6_NEPPI|nr:sushi, von Willebrand factor type A, EGF and pentraxin domain-containing protein 1 [Nephila pilipes]
MSPAAFFFVSLTAVLEIAMSTSCSEHILCQCGSSNKNYTFCVNDTWDEPFTCDRWAHCETCEDNITHCVTCPPSRTGPFCLEAESAKGRAKRQSSNTPEQNQPGYFGTCPPLKNPNSGSFNCKQSGNNRVCIGRCLPGYVFDDKEYTNEITLECRERYWQPRRYFPSCKSDGVTYRRSCRCEKGGVCDDKGKCICPTGTTGAFCEHYERGKVFCPDPGIPRDGERVKSDGSDASSTSIFEAGESVIYSCKGDLLLQGLSFITCKSDGTWSSSRPQCIRSRDHAVYCPDPGQIPFGNRRNGDGTLTRDGSTQVYTSGQSVIYRCRRGYELSGNGVINCLQTGEWSSPTPRCILQEPEISGFRGGQVFCIHPGVNENTELTGTVQNAALDQEFPPGIELRYECKEGFQHVGPLVLYCLPTGQWSSPAPNCRRATSTTRAPVFCIHPGVNENTELTGNVQSADLDQEFPPGIELRYKCREGFQHVGPLIIWAVCARFLLFSVSFAANSSHEISNHCIASGVDPNAEVEPPYTEAGETFEEGEVLLFTCKEGYHLEGVASITCKRNGQWSNPAPRCILTGVVDGSSNDAQCRSNVSISNGKIVVVVNGNILLNTSSSRINQDDFQYPSGTQLSYFCENGYALRGESKLVCENTGFWSAEAPVCIEDCGRSRLQSIHRIAHGTKTVAGEWPWTVALAVTRSNATKMVCGGALLDRRTVLTAAHCLEGYQTVVLYFGKYHRSNRLDDSEVKTRTSSRLISHPRFNIATYDNDIALVKFVPDVQYSERIQKICLPNSESTKINLVPGQKGYVTGWGFTEKQMLSEELLMAHLPVQSNQNCVKAYARSDYTLNLNYGKFCAGGSINTCQGDSGSPLVFYDRDTDRHTVEGLVSFGLNEECGLPDRYTVFTRVVHFMPWILRNWPR